MAQLVECMLGKDEHLSTELQNHSVKAGCGSAHWQLKKQEDPGAHCEARLAANW